MSVLNRYCSPGHTVSLFLHTCSACNARVQQYDNILKIARSALWVPLRNISSTCLIKSPRHTKTIEGKRNLPHEGQMILIRSHSESSQPHMAQITTQHAVTLRLHTVPLLSLSHRLLLFCPNFSLFLKNLLLSRPWSSSSKALQT